MTLLMALVTGALSSTTPASAIRTIADGAPAIVVDGHAYPPIILAVNNKADFNRDDVLVGEIRQAHEAGIDLFRIEMLLDPLLDAAAAAAVVDTFCAANPEGYFMVSVWLGADGAWLSDHPEECITTFEGKRQHHASPASLPWREKIRAALRERVGEIMEGPHGHRFFGVELAGLMTAEWYYQTPNAYMDYSPANLAGFRRWLHENYPSDAALAEAWGDPEATRETARIPLPEARNASEWGPFRHPVKHRAAMDLQRYQSEVVAEAIGHFAGVVKEVSGGRLLTAVFYGYTMEMNNNGPRALAQAGHLALGKLLDCPDIDIIRAPYSYLQRRLGEPGHLHSPGYSFALHGKLGLYDDDTFTDRAIEPEARLTAPGWPDRTRTSAETVAVNLRNAGMFFSAGCGLSYFDLLSDARWSDPAVWAMAPVLAEAVEARGAQPFMPEVACMISEQTPHLMRADTYPHMIQAASWWRSELDRLGAPVGYYQQRDLALLPETVKVVVLANAYALSEAEKAWCARFTEDGGTVIWTYASDIWGSEGADPERVSALVGMDVSAHFDKEPMDILVESTGERELIDDDSWQPRFVLGPEGIDVLARYAGSREILAGARRAGRGRIIYTAMPRLPVGLLRDVCRDAGVHLYHDIPNATGVAGHHLFVHFAGPGTHTFRWPRHCAEIIRLYPGEAKTVARDTATWDDTFESAGTALYRCIEQEDQER